MHKAEKEWALGILVTVAIRQGRWVAVESNTFLEILALNWAPWGQHRRFQNDTIDAVHDMAEEGLLELVRVGQMDYIVPHNKLLEMIGRTTHHLMVAPPSTKAT